MKLGPTGDFPDGKIDDTDEGGLNMAIAADPENGIVRLEFGKPIAWIGLPPDLARKLGAMLIQKAKELQWSEIVEESKQVCMTDEDIAKHSRPMTGEEIEKLLNLSPELFKPKEGEK